MKNRNEDNVEITRNQRFLKLIVVDILQWVVKAAIKCRIKNIKQSISISCFYKNVDKMSLYLHDHFCCIF